MRNAPSPPSPVRNAIHRVEYVFFDRDRRIAITQVAAPHLVRAGFRPGRCQSFRFKHKVAVRPVTLRSIGWRLRCGGNNQSTQRKDDEWNSVHCFAYGFSNSFASIAPLRLMDSIVDDRSFHGCPSNVAVILNGSVNPSTTRKSEKLCMNSP